MLSLLAKSLLSFLAPTSRTDRTPLRILRSTRTLRALCGGGLVAAAAVALASPAAAQTVQHLPGTTSSGTPVQTSTVAIPVTVPITATGSITSIQVLTAGSPYLDFADAHTGDTCSLNSVYAAGGTCTVNVVFTPTTPGRRPGAVVLLGSNNLVIGRQLIDSIATGPLALIRPATITDPVGVGNKWVYDGPADEGGVADMTPIFLPSGVAIAGNGNMYISDSGNNRIRKVVGTGSQGRIYTYAGNGIPGSNGNGVPATTASISNPAGMVLDGAGNLFFADSGSNTVRRVDAATGIITNVAGQPGVSGYSGDGGLASAATLSSPEGVTFDADGNLYIADTNNSAIRRVDAVTGVITTVVGGNGFGYSGDGGPALSAQLNQPWSTVLAADGTMYIADFGNSLIRKVTPSGAISTIAGVAGSPGSTGDGALATTEQLYDPTAIALDPLGDLYIADSANNRIERLSITTGKMSAILGGSAITSDPSGLVNSSNASLYGPYALTFDGTGNLFIADLFHNKIREMAASQASAKFPDMRVGKTSSPAPFTVENDGNSTLTPGSVVYNQSGLDGPTTTCGSTMVTVAPGANCTLGVVFKPTVVSPTGSFTYGSLSLNSDSANSPTVVSDFAEVLSVEPTTTNLVSSLNPSGLGAAVTFTASVVETSGTVTPTGTIIFYDGTTPISGSVTLDATGTAKLTTSSLTLGQHAITASYSGDNNDAAGVSPTVNQNVLQTTKMFLVSSLNPAAVAQSVNFTATITAASPITGGTITFLDGSTTMGTAAISNAGVAVFTTPSLTAGTHTITARFDTTGSSLSSTATLTQVINKVSSSTTLVGLPTTVSVGANVALTATVASNGGPVPTGNVTFKYGSTTLGTVALDTTGTAALSVATLPPGVDAITAVYAGDSSTNGSSSTAVNITVNRLDTVTTLGVSASPAAAGQPLTLTANVSLAANELADGTLTGTVSFLDGTTVLGTATVGANGTASFTTSALSVNTHSLTASYAGSTNYAPSVSSAVSETVQKSSTTTTLNVSSASVVAGTTVTMTATVTTTGTKPTGNVTFSDEDGTLGTGTVNASGVATFSTGALPVGTRHVVATYNGDANYTTSQSTPVAITSRLGTTSLTISASIAQLTYGSPEAVTVRLTSDGALPTGSHVSLMDGGNLLASIALDNTGAGSFSSSTLPVGTHTLMASYAGDPDNAAAQSTTVTVTVLAASTSTALTTSGTPVVYGNPVTFTATVTSAAASSTGTITFQSAGTVLGTATLNGSGVATLTLGSLGIGSHAVQAVYSGDATHAASTSPVVTELIVEPTSTTLGSSANPVTAGLPLNLVAQVIGTTVTGTPATPPTGTVTFHEGTTVLGTASVNSSGTATLTTSTLTVGTHNVVASYGGDNLYKASDSSALAQVVQTATTQTVLSASATNVNYGSPLTLSAHINGNGGVISGAVTFMDGSTALGQGATTNGNAALTLSTLSPGMHQITAMYAGDSDNIASTSAPVTVQVQEVTTTTLLSGSNPALTLSTVTLTASVRNSALPLPTGTVRFLEGTTLLGTAPVDANGNATFNAGPFAAGTHVLLASYSGDGGNLPSSSQPLSQVVTLRPTQNVLSASAPTGAGILTLISAIHWTGPVAPTGTITFHSATGTIGTSTVDSNGIGTLNVNVNVVSGTVIATYGGDAAYAASDSTAANVGNTSDTATDFTMLVNPAAVTVATKKYVTAQITIKSVNGFTDTLSLGCLGLPYAATCTFDKDSISLPANGTVVANVTIDTGSPLNSGGQASASLRKPSSGNPAKTALAVLPAAGLLGWLLMRRRRFALPALLMLLITAMLLPTVGCGTLNENSTPAGSYVIQLSAGGQKTGVTLSTNVQFTVTQ